MPVCVTAVLPHGSCQAAARTGIFCRDILSLELRQGMFPAGRASLSRVVAARSGLGVLCESGCVGRAGVVCLESVARRRCHTCCSVESGGL